MHNTDSIQQPKTIMYSALALLLACGLVHGKDIKENSVTYRLMTYNVGSAANLPLGPRQIGQIAETIIDNRVDIAGLTEMEEGTIWHDKRDHVAELGSIYDTYMAPR